MNMYVLIGKKAVEFDSRNPEHLASGGTRPIMTHDFVIGDEFVRVSTVFLSIDHQWLPNGKPVHFETMVFGGEMDGTQNRYCTYDKAVAGHKDMCEIVGGARFSEG